MIFIFIIVIEKVVRVPGVATPDPVDALQGAIGMFTLVPY